MAGGELAAQLAVLEEALKRLEGELARDAAWCALQADAGLDETSRAHLITTLQANPVYRAWQNIQDAAATLQANQVSAVTQADPAHVAKTLADALQSLPPDEDVDVDVAATLTQALAANVAVETAVQADTAVDEQPPARLTAPEQEAYDVGHRATQAVERILAIPVVEPIAPRNSAPPAPSPPPVAAPAAPPPSAAAAPPSDPAATIDQSVPLEADDIAFLLKPAARLTTAEDRPFLKRLVAETQSVPTKAAVLPATSDPFMVAPAPTPPPEKAPAPTPAETGPDAGRKPRLARLLKAWSRH